jgi:hypothetical protein
MTDQPDKGSGSPLSFENVRNLGRSEHAKAPGEPVADHTAANLAFEATLRTPPPPPDDEAGGSGHGVPSFEAVPASDVVGEKRLSTATTGFRPAVAAVVASVSGPGGNGWNVRGQDNASGRRAQAEAVEGAPAWSPRPSGAMSGDRSTWDTPIVRRRRRSGLRILTRTVIALVLVAVVGFAVFKWASGRGHALTTIATPASVGSLTAIHTPATAAVTREMEKVMLAYGATRVVSGVYGAGGQPTLVVLLAQGPNIETTSSQFFNDFASGLRTDGVTVSRGRTIAATTGGSDFVCSPATRAAPLTPVSLCGWDDGFAIGLVMDVSGQPVTTTLHEAEAARTAGES